MIKKNQDELFQENKKLLAEIKNLKKNLTSTSSKNIKATKEKITDEEFYHTLFEFSPAGIIIEDKNGKILDVNPAWCKSLGYNRKDIIGENVKILAHPDNKGKVIDNINKLLAGEKSKHIVKGIKKDVTACYIQLNERAINLPNGEKVILSISQDMTKEVQTQQALIESEERLQMIIDSTG